jgi:poly(3-hydroxyalkanoate) depolymerase
MESVSEAARRGAGVVQIDGLGIRYVVQGDGPPLLLIMGLGGHLDLWQPLQSGMGDFTTITFDAPGAGRSSTPCIPLRMNELARVTARLLDVLGFDRVHVLGVSLGGALAQELTRRAPHRVRRLVLVSTACGVGSVPGHPLALLSLATPWQSYSRSLFESQAPLIFGGRLRTDPDPVRRVAGRWAMQPPSVWGYLSQMSSLWSWSSLPWLHRIAQLTLVLSGDDDPLVPAVNSRILASCIPRAQLEILPGGHLLPLERPDTVARLVREFLREDTGFVPSDVVTEGGRAWQ